MVASEQDPAPDVPEGPGHRLRLGREQRGVAVAEVADALHLNTSMVEALEADDYDNLPPATFTKGYLRAYARYLGLNEDVVLASYERFGLGNDRRPLSPAAGGDAPAGRPVRRRWLWPAALGLLALVGGAVFVMAGGWRLPDWVGDIRSQGLDTLMPVDGADGETSEPSTENGGDDDAAASAKTASETADTKAPGSEAATSSNSREDGVSPNAGADDAGSQAVAEPTEGGAAGDEVSPDAGEADGSELSDRVGGGEAPASGAASDTMIGAEPATQRLPERSGRRRTDPGRLLDQDPLRGAEALLQGDRIANAPIEGEVDEFGGPLGEEPPQPGRDANRVEPPSSPDASRASDGASSADGADGSGDEGAASDDAALNQATSDDSDPATGEGGETVAGSEVGPPQAGDAASEAGDRARLQLRFSGQSWMEVRDARGERLLFELVTQPGERELAGVPPFQIVIGDVEQVDVRYEGEPVDLTDYSRQGMARLELGGS